MLSNINYKLSIILSTNHYRKKNMIEALDKRLRDMIKMYHIISQWNI